MSESTIKSFISDNQNMFIKVSNNVEKITGFDDVTYSILNYDKIIGDMTQYIEGYLDYHNKGIDKYVDKILNTTITFCDKMFDDVAYRKIITLEEFKDINHSFLVKTKELKILFDNCDKAVGDEKDYELKQMVNLLNKQYLKVSRVMKDDMSIYLWLSTQGSSIPSLRIPISADLLRTFNDKTSPVMHRYKR